MQDSKATMPRMRGTARKVTGSVALIPYRRLLTTRIVARPFGALR
jgi:hypothetical protein